MGSRIQCFFLEETDQCRVSLRRFCYHNKSETPCPGPLGYHNASEIIALQQNVSIAGDTHGDNFPHADPRWPLRCEVCPYLFRDEDEWQYNPDKLWKGCPDGMLYTLRDAPIGAMWNAHWMVERRTSPNSGQPGSYIGPDGRCLVVRLPDGHDWMVDGPASNGPGWSRRGEVPLIVATPSILSHNGGYHGYLGASDGSAPGWLVEC